MTQNFSQDNAKPKVVMALSGGVDSSVAAALLKQSGYQLIGVTMRLWSESGCEQENRCCTPETRQIAGQLAKKIDIPFEILDAEEVFYEQVVQSFLESYLHGFTPNPCIGCNRQIKWAFLLAYASKIGAKYVATGHYARVIQNQNGLAELWQGVDPSKDQSYVLSMLTQAELSKTLFPLGNLDKKQVRLMAHTFDLPAADQPESQDLCFLGNKDYRDFIKHHAPQAVQPGLIINQHHKVLGEHQGLAFYTIGQRKGLPPASQALYVLEKRLEENILVVGFEDELGKTALSTSPVNWIAGTSPTEPFEAQVKIRFKAEAAPALVSPCPDGSVHVKFQYPLRDITLGQVAVIYAGEKVLGGGTINQAIQ